MENVIITGGSSGLGLSLVKLYLQRGCRVGIIGRDEKKWQENSLSSNTRVIFYKANIENRDEIKKSVSEFNKNYGNIDLVIVNAGIGNSRKNVIPDFDRSEQILKINVLGTLYTIEAAFDVMYPAKKGAIAIISSVAAYVGLSGNAAYCASKSALQRMAETFAIDFAKFGIFVTCVSPGFIDTPLTQKNNHKMPYMITSEKAAYLIAEGIDRKSHWIGFPWQLYYLMSGISILPSKFYIWLAQRFNLTMYKNK